MNNAISTIESFGAASLVTCPAADLAWLREFFEPSLTFGGNVPASERIQLCIDPAKHRELKQSAANGLSREFDCFTLDGSFERFPGFVAEDGSLNLWLNRFGVGMTVSPNRCDVMLYSDSDKPSNRLALMRVVRECATVRAVRRGAIPFHGAACGIEGAAVAFLGSKTAGKTTALVHCLESPRFQFLANDRFFVTDGQYGHHVSGMPTIVKVRWGTLRLFPDLERQSQAHPYHRQRTMQEVLSEGGEPSQTDEAASFSQAQFLHLTNSRAISQAPLGSFLFLERDDSVYVPRLLPMPTDVAAARLRESLLTPGEMLQTSEVFDSAVHRIICEDQLLSTCRKIAANGYCWRYLQGIRTISQPALPQLSFRAA